jgi:hypothetical protein
MVVEREIIRRDNGDAECLLARPVGGAERRRGCQKGVLVGSRPVALKRGLQLAVRTDARSTQCCDCQCGDRNSGDRHGLTPSVGGKGHGDATVECPRAQSRGIASAPPGHPARGRRRVEAGLLACGSLPRSDLPGLTPSGAVRHWLTAYSCGGSAGIVPITRSARTGFPLDFGGSNSPKNLDARHYGRQPTARQVKYKDIFISLYWLISSGLKATPCRRRE